MSNSLNDLPVAGALFRRGRSHRDSKATRSSPEKTENSPQQCLHYVGNIDETKLPIISDDTPQQPGSSAPYRYNSVKGLHPTKSSCAPSVVMKQPYSLGCAQREELNGHSGKVVWLTGLSGAGKSTVADALTIALHARRQHSYVLDGDNLRRTLNSDLGFSDVDRKESMRRTAEVAKLMVDAGLIVIVALISPFRRERDLARQQIGTEKFIEVHISTPLSVCEQRDTKGLYALARNGKLPNMTGIDSAFEAPLAPELVINCGEKPVNEAVADLLAVLAR